MHAKSNRMTYRFNEQEQQLLELNPSDINKQHNEQADLKRAFTIVPNHLKVPATLKSTVEAESILPAPIETYGQLEQDKNDWPDVEELEALIRGDAKSNYSNQAHNKEQLELPVQFEYDTLSKSTEPDNLNSKLTMIETSPFLDERLISNYDIVQQEKIEVEMVAPVKPFTEEQAGYYKYSATNENKPYDISVAWGKVVTAVASSIVTGVLIGYVLLLAVYGVNVWPINVISSQLFESNKQTGDEQSAFSPVVLPKDTDETTAVTEQENSVGLENSVSQIEGVNNSTAVVQPMQSFTYTVLQAGVFTKEDTKQALVDRLQAGGYPAASINTNDGKMVVFAGIASSSQSTFQINHMKDIELYRKSFSVHAPKLSDDEAKDKQLQQWVYNVHDMMKSSMLMSEAQFEQTSFSPIYNDSYQLLVDKYAALTKETEQLSIVIEDEVMVKHLQWHQEEFKHLHEQWTKYQEKPSLASLLQIQNYLLSMITYQIDWFQN